MSEPTAPPVLRFRRTVAEARRAFEIDVLPVVNDYRAREGRELLEAAEAKARQHADKRVGELEAEVREIRDEALRDLTGARDGLEALTSEGSLGRISAEEYGQRLNVLRHQQELAERDLTRAEELIDQAQAIEEDPIRYFDDLSRRMNLLQEWPW